MTTHTWRSVVGARGSHYYDGKDPQNKLVGQFPVGLNYLILRIVSVTLGRRCRRMPTQSLQRNREQQEQARV